jgi:DNA primase large subunit
MDDWEAKRIISLLEDIKSTVNLAYFGTIAVMLFWAAVGYISKLF